MSRYYVLTERDGVGVIEATAVDEANPFTIRFVAGSKITEFDRHDLVWWSPVESSVPAPFANLGAISHAHSAKSSGGRAQSPWEDHSAATQEMRSNADSSRRSAAAFGGLVKAARACVPPGWNKAALELKVSFELTEGRYRIMHWLRNPDTGAERVDFSDALFAAIEVFHRIEVESGQNWNRSVVTLCLGESGQCDAEINRDHGRNFGTR